MATIKPGALNERDEAEETGDIRARVEGLQVRPGVPSKDDVNQDGEPPVDPDKMPDISIPGQTPAQIRAARKAQEAANKNKSKGK